MARIRPRTILRAGNASVAGSNIAAAGGGSLVPSSSLVAGAGFRRLTGIGVLVPNTPSILVGISKRMVKGSGALASAAVAIAGIAKRIHKGTGALAAAAGSMAGSASFGPLWSFISVSSPSQNEGNSGSANMAFTVTLSSAKPQNVTFDYATRDGTATAGSDYTSTSGSMTFTPGQVTKTVNVPILGDTTVEADETFFLDVSNVRYT